MKISSFLLSLFFLSTAHAETTSSRLLRHVQETYLTREAAPYPILIMDRDDLEWRFARAGAIGQGGARDRERILREYVREKTGVTISANAASNFEPYLSVLKDAAVAMPALRDGTSGRPVVDMCAVFPPDPNRNRRLETERLVQLRTQEAYGTHSYGELRATLDYEDAFLFSVLHEAGHCLDRFFFPQLLEVGADPSLSHLSESFAEAVGLFLLAKEGRGAAVAETRAYLRELYSYFLEPYFAAHPELGMGNEAFAYGGLIYHLSPVIRASAAELPAHARDSLPQLLELARSLVNRHALEGRFLTALHAGYAEGHAVALARYRDFADRMPDLFAGYPARMESYWQSEDSFRSTAFRVAPAEPPATALKAFDEARACAAFRAGNTEALLAQVEELRQDLRQGTPAFDAQKARYELLSGLWGTLPGRCRGGQSLRGDAIVRSAPLFFDLVLPGR